MSKLEKILGGLDIFKQYHQLDISITQDTIYAGGELPPIPAEALVKLGWNWDGFVWSFYNGD